MNTETAQNLPAEIVELIALHNEARKVHADACKRAKKDRSVTPGYLFYLRQNSSRIWWQVREAYSRHGL